jgi:predicted dehydrogenase
MTARIGVIGAGWRAEYYLRVAAALPDRFEITRVLVRSDAAAARLAEQWPVSTTCSAEDFLAGRYDFVVVSTPPAVAADLTTAAARAGHVVLTETPPAPTRERLLSYYRELAGMPVQVAEQYRFQPQHAARLSIAGSGRLGRICSTRMSVAHGYHGVSLIRAVLGAGFAPVTVTGWSIPGSVVPLRGRAGWQQDLTERPSPRTVARLDFAGDRTGIYEFESEQYFSPIRPRHIEVYGTHGQIADDAVSYALGPGRVTRADLRRTATGVDGDLDGWFLESVSCGDRIEWASPYRDARLNDDELAVAELMSRMAHYAAGGPPVYPLSDGCHDQLISLAIDEAVGRSPISVEELPWADEISVLDAKNFR